MTPIRLVLALMIMPAASTARADGPATPFGTLAPLVAAPAAPDSLPSIRLIAHQEAAKAGVPFDLVDAVIKIESDYRADRIGDVGEIGLMQVRPATAAMLGFRGAASDLAVPQVNIHYGATYLGAAWRLAGGDVCRTLMKYRAGHGEERMSPLSATYCSRARAHLVAQGAPLAASIKETDLQSVASMPSTGVTSRRERNSGVFWAKLEARIKRINRGIEARWRRVASR